MNTDEYNNGFLTGERVFCTQATNGLPIKTAGRIIPKPPGCYPTNMVRIYFDPHWGGTRDIKIEFLEKE